MPNFLSSNLKFLRKKYNKSQSDIGYQLNKAHTSIGNWEKGISEPSLAEVEEIARIFEITPADLLYTDFTQGKVSEIADVPENSNIGKVVGKVVGKVRGSFSNKNDPSKGLIAAPKNVSPAGFKPALTAPQVITIDTSGNENIVYVQVKARAGYLAGYADPEYIETLPAFKLPGYNHGTYRLFEVDGVSMYNTLQDKDRCIARWAQLSEGKDDRVYVIVTRTEGLLIKRCIFRLNEGKIVCKSDNNHNGEYPPIVIDVSDVLELWYVVERWTRQLPAPGELYHRITRLEADVALLANCLKNHPEWNQDGQNEIKSQKSKKR
jgi:DNA-binding XRE family transcriptional regulator